jgi:hypothetical protein
MSVSQTDFSRAMLDPGLAAPAGLTNPDGAQASKRFNVYRNNVTVSLTESLEVAFPVVRKLVGTEFFRAMAQVYLRQHPPRSPLMMFFGDDMPAFLAAFEPVAHLHYLPDVARLEFARRQSYHAADAQGLPPETFQTLPPDRLMAARLRFAPAMRLVRSHWPVHGIWRRNTEDDAPKPAVAGENVLVTRPEFDPVMTTLAPGGGTFLASLIAGARFSEALESATQQVPDFDLSAVLGALFAGAAIIELNEDPA